MIVDLSKSFKVTHRKQCLLRILVQFIMTCALAKMSKNNCMKYLIAENLLRQVVQISQMTKVVGILFVINTQYNVSSLLYNKFNCSCCWRQFQIRRRNFYIFSISRQGFKLVVIRCPRPSIFARGNSTWFLATPDGVTFHLKKIRNNFANLFTTVSK